MCTCSSRRTIWWCAYRTPDGWYFWPSTFCGDHKGYIISLPQICDFGSARKYHHTTTKSIHGTYPWTAPEVTIFISLKIVHCISLIQDFWSLQSTILYLVPRKWKELPNCQVPQCDATNPRRSWSQLAFVCIDNTSSFASSATALHFTCMSGPLFSVYGKEPIQVQAHFKGFWWHKNCHLYCGINKTVSIHSLCECWILNNGG